jgi:hypothetical protein
MRVWIGFVWLCIETSGRFQWKWYCTFRLHKSGHFVTSWATVLLVI